MSNSCYFRLSSISPFSFPFLCSLLGLSQTPTVSHNHHTVPTPLSLSLSLDSYHNSLNFSASVIYITDSHNTMSSLQLSVSRLSSFGLFLLILCVPTYGRFLTQYHPLSSDLISDGVHDRDSGWGSYRVLNRLSGESSTSTCDQTYGFLPCTTSLMGNLFLMVVYGYLMYLAAKSLSDGSEHLLEILGPGFVGGLVLPILGALPEALLVLGAHLVNRFINKNNFGKS